MSALTLTLKAAPDQRLDLSPLIPERLAGCSEAEVAAIPVGTRPDVLRVGDVFRIRMGDAATLRFSGGSERFDHVGHGMTGGTVMVNGDVGICAGRQMRGGRLAIGGNAGHWAASGLTGGHMTIAGNCGDFLGGPLAGEMAGMRGGSVHVAGRAGMRAGDRLRRGIIVVDGKAGDFAGSRMIAGTLIVSGGAGRLPGYLMRRGSIILARGADEFAPTFLDCGAIAPTFIHLMARELAGMGLAPGALKRRRYIRLGGDTAVLGKGEILVSAG